MNVSRLYMRTSAEAHLYMDQLPCACGDIQFIRQSAVMADGDVLCSHYSGKCRTCGTMREFTFELPPQQRPITNQLEFGGSDPSRLLDPGEWMAISDHWAELVPCTRHNLDIARAALEEVLKFFPEGKEYLPSEAFRTERGRAVRDRDRGRLQRSHLEAELDRIRKALGDLPSPGLEAIKRAFDAHFGSKERGIFAMKLPDYVLRRTSGEFEGDGGWDVRYKFGTEDGVEYLDLLLSHRRTNDRVCRVHPDGRVEMIDSSTEGMDPKADAAFEADVQRRFQPT